MREIKSIHLGAFVEFTRSGHGIGDLGTEEKQARRRKRQDAVNWGDKIHLNGSPYSDERGSKDAEVIGEDAWAEVLKVNDGYIFTHWTWDGERDGGPIDFGSVADNYGCTPTLKANKKAEDTERHELVIWQVYAEGTDKEVRSNTLSYIID